MYDRGYVKDTYFNCGQKHLMYVNELKITALLLVHVQRVFSECCNCLDLLF